MVGRNFLDFFYQTIVIGVDCGFFHFFLPYLLAFGLILFAFQLIFIFWRD